MTSNAHSLNLVLKLSVLIAGIAVTAAALLAVRQQRILAAHDVIASHNRVASYDVALRQMRSDIANLLAPNRLQQLASTLGDMRPIPPAWCSTGQGLIWAPRPVAEPPAHADAPHPPLENTQRPGA